MFTMTIEKLGHFAQIGVTSAAGLGASSLVTTFDPSQAISVVQIVAQAIIAIVTIFATLKKAFQRPVVNIVAPKSNV